MYGIYNECRVRCKSRNLRCLWVHGHSCDAGDIVLVSINPFRTAVPFWGQTTQISSNLSPNGTAVLKGLRPRWHAQVPSDSCISYSLLVKIDNTSIKKKLQLQNETVSFSDQ